ncbi:hypothetical protein GALMADRAFT_132550 [Galerina marginata CBS 339.88]|uniref:F-box domain-containing protein n=1 Tax=Galerina marginata (strain CBS 339.88) TaxID=685588 RepID=A0A067TRT7_GALM3|nr:hypothetical protein GALMADRAFT_132550 [Galerina marginata CBS 339.88]
MVKCGRNHQRDEDQEDNFLSSYQLDQCDWEKRLRRAKTVNILALSVRKEYREKLRSSGVLRKTLSRSKDIEFFRTIPVEILLEILEYLHPIDLLQLMKAHPAFRELLKDCSCTSVWRSTFGNYSDIPKIPSNLTGYKWADLLFNPSICEKCGASPAPPSITFHRRWCGGCIRKEFIPTYECYNQYGRSVKNLARDAKIIMISPSVEGANNSSDSFNKAELCGIRSALQRLKIAIAASVPDAKEALESYKLERRELSRTNTAQLLSMGNILSEYAPLQSTFDSSLLDAKARFKRLGFEPADVDKAVFDEQILTNLVNTTGISKLRKRTSASAFVQGVHKDYCISFLPATWAYLPTFSAVMQFDSVLRLFSAPRDDPLVDEDVLKLLPQEVDDWTTQTMNQLISFLPSPSSCAQEFCGSTISPDLSALNLGSSHGLSVSVEHEDWKMINMIVGTESPSGVR